MYQNFAGGEGRCSCQSKEELCKLFGVNADGQVKRRPKPWIGTEEENTKQNAIFFDKSDYCETCRKVKSSSPVGKHEYVIDCRTEKEVNVI